MGHIHRRLTPIESKDMLSSSPGTRTPHASATVQIMIIQCICLVTIYIDIRFVDWVRHSTHIPSYLPHFFAAHYPGQECSSCLHPILRPCENSVASTSLCPTSTTNCAAYCGRGSILNACITCKTVTQSGLLTI